MVSEPRHECEEKPSRLMSTRDCQHLLSHALCSTEIPVLQIPPAGDSPPLIAEIAGDTGASCSEPSSWSGKGQNKDAARFAACGKASRTCLQGLARATSVQILGPGEPVAAI